jgi:hypothetical protein
MTIRSRACGSNGGIDAQSKRGDFTQSNWVRRRIAVLESFDNRDLQHLFLSICSICTHIFFETPMIEQRSG